MNHRVEKFVESMTSGGAASLGEVAQGIIDHSQDRAGILSIIWGRSYDASGFHPTNEDRATLDRIENAGKGMLWTLFLQPADVKSAHVLSVGHDFDERAYHEAAHVPTLAFAQNLSVLPDGEVLLWDPRGEDDLTGVVIPPFADASDVVRHVAVTPETRRGLPMMTPLMAQRLLGVTVGAVELPRLSGESGPIPA